MGIFSRDLARLCVVAGVSSLASACLSSASHNIIGRKNVVSRAEFDLACPRQYMQFVVLQKNGDLVTSYGVLGCGKRAAYVRGPQDTFVLDRAPTPAQQVAAHGSSTPPPAAWGVLPRSAPPRASGPGN